MTFITLVQTDQNTYKQFLKNSINSLSIVVVIWEGVPFFGNEAMKISDLQMRHTARFGYCEMR